MLSESALGLIRDVFSNPDLFRRAHRIRRREVAWRPLDPSAVFEHSAVVVSEEELLAGLPVPVLHAEAEAPVTLLASRSLPGHSFGTRTAEAFQVTLKPGADAAACCIESFPEGWLFLVPNSHQTAWLLSVGAGDLLSESRVIVSRIDVRQPAAGRFPCYPAIAQPLTGADWLACGSAAMAFDPICGDGTAHAVREAVLAAAVVRAAEEGEPWEDVREHYESRMILGFRRHLALALSFYRLGVHDQPTRLVLTLSAGVNPAEAVDLSRYRLVAPGPDGKFNTADDQVIPFASAVYDPARHTITLTTVNTVNFHYVYRFTAEIPSVGTDVFVAVLNGKSSFPPGTVL